MSGEPIKAGDLAEVVWGMLGEKSPNLGLIVRVIALHGESPQYGRIWRVESEYAEIGTPRGPVPPGQVNCAQSWLKKIEPPAPTQTTETSNTNEVTA